MHAITTKEKRREKIGFSVILFLVTGMGFRAEAAAPYVLPGAPREHTRQLDGKSGSYEVTLGGTLDEFNSAAYPPSYGGHMRLEPAFQPNHYLVLENCGEVNVVHPRIVVNGRRNWFSGDDILAEIFSPGMTGAEKAMAIWKFTAGYGVQAHDNNRRVGPPFPDSDEKPSLGQFKERGNPVKAANYYYCSGCSLSASNFTVLCRHAGLKSRCVWLQAVGLPYANHCVSEVFYDGAWHLFDPERRAYYLEADNVTVGSYATLHENPALVTRTHDGGFAGQGMPSHDKDYRDQYPPREMPVDVWLSTMDMVLRPGEKFIWRWDDCGKFRCGDNKRNIHPERPEGILPYMLANGKMIYRPRLQPDAVAKETHARDNLQVVPHPDEGGQLQPASASAPASVVYQISSPYPIVGGLVGGNFFRETDPDTIRVFLSVHYGELPDDRWSAWTEIGSADRTGSFEHYIPLDEALQYKSNPEIHDYRVKFELVAGKKPSSTRLKNLYFETGVQMADTSLPSLSVGLNKVVYRSESSPGARVRIVHGWEESSATVPPTPPPAPLEPADGQRVAIRPGMRLSWAAAEDPDGQPIADHHIQVSPREDFLHPVSPNFDRILFSGATEWEIPEGQWLGGNTTYYWRVRAKDAWGAWSDWSPTWSFTTGELRVQ